MGTHGEFNAGGGGGNPVMDYPGGVLHATETGISSGLMGHEAHREINR